MEQKAAVRKSHCTTCGKRLSEKTPSGEIRWQASHVDDKGIYCETCGAKLNVTKSKKDRPS